MSITIRQSTAQELRWRDYNSFFLSSKKINGKKKGEYTTPLNIYHFKDHCLFQYHIKDERVDKLIVYYDEVNLIKTLKEKFYLEGHRDRINQDDLFIEEIVFDFKCFVDMNEHLLSYPPIPKLIEIYEKHYMQILGEWVYKTHSVEKEIEALHSFDFFPEYEKKYKLLAESYLRKESLGNKPKNNKTLSTSILYFKPIDKFVDDINAINVEFRKETK